MLNKSIMNHFIYKTTHVNGRYYIGRHSTNNVDDGYFGSGHWPKSIKDKSLLTREILEYAVDVKSLIALEEKYLKEHYGKTGCMNATIDPVGFNSENNPMKNPIVSNKISGNNHWTRRSPDLISKGSKHWMNLDPVAKEQFVMNHPNKDGRNAKLAMERGTHVNLTNNPSVKRSQNGTHQMFKRADGSSIGNDANIKRVADGTHNLLGPELNKKRIKDGTHNLLGPTSNLDRLANGTHPSQKLKTCEYCSKVSSIGMYARWHGPNCRTLKS